VQRLVFTEIFKNDNIYSYEINKQKTDGNVKAHATSNKGNTRKGRERSYYSQL